MTGGAATAGTGGLHVSHTLESRIPCHWPFPVQFLPTANTKLKLCCGAGCTICSVKHTDTDCRADKDTTALNAVQIFEPNWYYCAVLKRIRSLMLMFCRHHPAVVNIVQYYKLFVCKARRVQVHSIFLTKQSIFNMLINLHAICVSNIVQQLRSSTWIQFMA